MLTAQQGYYNARLAVLATRLQRLTSLVDLYRALGGGWSAGADAALQASLQTKPDGGETTLR